jgi:hypothetical protein
MIAFYLCALVADSLKLGGRVEATAEQNDSHCVLRAGTESVELKIGTLENLFPLTLQVSV